jgi:alkanesulfonate monooxygenase SsuD/methylene tetrahydromethanopterin reductase-like flavin-dependent oxidoreductase (luciferase family)
MKLLWFHLMPSPNLIAATLARRTHDAAICAMGNSIALYNPPTRVVEELAMIDCISDGRLTAGLVGFLQFGGVAESRAEAMDRYAEAAEYFYGRCLHVDPRFAAPPGYVSEATQRSGLQSQVQKAAGVGVGSTAGTRFASVARDMDAIVDRGYVVIGSPDEVAEQLREVASTLNVGHLMLLLQFGTMGKELTLYNTRLFAERVMPKLRDIFGDWEDRWWPQPMPMAERASSAMPRTAGPAVCGPGGLHAAQDAAGVGTPALAARQHEAGEAIAADHRADAAAARRAGPHHAAERDRALREADRCTRRNPSDRRRRPSRGTRPAAYCCRGDPVLDGVTHAA